MTTWARVVPGAEGLALRAGTGGGTTFLLDVDCDAVPPPANGCSGGEVPPVATGGGDSGEDGSAAEHDRLLTGRRWAPVSATAQEDAVQAEDGSWSTLVDTTSAVARVARQVALGCG